MLTRRILPALLLIAASFVPCGPSAVLRAAGEEGPALIHGILYRADEVTRLSGALVTAINVRTGRRYSSVHTGENGAYEIAGLPAGTYDIAIDAPDEHLYVTDGLIELHENQRLLLSLSLKKKGGAAPGAPAQGGATQSFTDPGAVAEPDTSLAAPGTTAAPENGTTPDEKKKSSKSSGKKSKKSGSKPSSGSGATAMLATPAPSVSFS
ncbi:MAG TPA: carboxypeptidase-like regulatory domain-containing protein [Candidatus Polarisedimenticolia bacterium]|nr:carboxypeptidase-like regulatory domain-containing protein [Candidatus Polarisedimenticolia bacterium]